MGYFVYKMLQVDQVSGEHIILFQLFEYMVSELLATAINLPLFQKINLLLSIAHVSASKPTPIEKKKLAATKPKITPATKVKKAPVKTKVIMPKAKVVA